MKFAYGKILTIPRLKLTIKTLALILIVTATVVSFLIWRFPFPKEHLAEVGAGASTLVLDQRGQIAAWRVDQQENWRWPVPLEQISPWMIRATIAAEDKRFESHWGVDPWAILRAVRQNLQRARKVSGASTLTMQTVRLLWPRRRTIRSKCVEAFRAMQLERIADKNQILELYFNHAPYGGNVVGIEAAARRYFNKRAADLTLGEAAMLAGVPQCPAGFNPINHLASALKRRKFVMDRMLALGFVTQRQVDIALRETICVRPVPVTLNVPGLADLVVLLRRGQGGIVQTTIDPQVQAAVSQAIEAHMQEYFHMGIDGAGVVVIDVHSSSLAAMVGSIDPQDRQTGWVNTVLAKRQPGSLLKPFIYAAAFGQGLLTPSGVVYDVPMVWGDYRPRNMDRNFLGAIPAQRALMLSRNVPAVFLLDQLGPRKLADDLQRVGLNLPAAEDQYGLSLALGTAEVSLLDVTNAYAALARLGRYSLLKIFSGQYPPNLTEVYSPGSAYLVLRALGAAKENEPARLIWKTGTSWQYRDAWAIALTPKYVVGVWCGRLSGKAHPALIGLHTAQPLALDIARHLSAGKASSWPKPPTVRTRTVCAISGVSPTAACPHSIDAEYIPGTSSDLPCVLHRFSSEGSQHHGVTVWPKNVAPFLDKPDEKPSQVAVSALIIRCPVNGGEYFLADNSTATGNHLDFIAQADSSVHRVFWFLNDQLTAVTNDREPFPWPMIPGNYSLTASDNQGRSASVAFRVTSLRKGFH